MESGTRKCTANLKGNKIVISELKKSKEYHHFISLRKNVQSKNILKEYTPKLEKNVKQVKTQMLNVIRNSNQNARHAVPLSEGICFCGGLEPSHLARFESYYHFKSQISVDISFSNFKIRNVFFVWTSTKSRHKLWFRTCLVCRKPR